MKYVNHGRYHERHVILILAHKSDDESVGKYLSMTKIYTHNIVKSEILCNVISVLITKEERFIQTESIRNSDR